MIRWRRETKSRQAKEGIVQIEYIETPANCDKSRIRKKRRGFSLPKLSIDPYPPASNRSNRLATNLAILAGSARASLRPHTTHTSTSGNVIIASVISTVTIIAISGASPPSCRARM